MAPQIQNDVNQYLIILAWIVEGKKLPFKEPSRVSWELVQAKDIMYVDGVSSHIIG